MSEPRDARIEWRIRAQEEARDCTPGWVGAQAAYDRAADELAALLRAAREGQ